MEWAGLDWDAVLIRVDLAILLSVADGRKRLRRGTCAVLGFIHTKARGRALRYVNKTSGQFLDY